jgi:hypothetical protein
MMGACAKDDVKLVSNIWDGSIAQSFAGGKGTATTPYLIETGAQLVLMKQYPSSYFMLVQNIDLNNKAWPSFDFSGTLDGNGFVISNLKVTKNGNNLGLFAILEGTVKNLTISGVTIESSGNNVGAIAGYYRDNFGNGSVTNCTIQLNGSSLISGQDYVGAVVGCADGGALTVTKCTVNGVSTENQIIGNEYVGGIIGYLRSLSTPTPMEDCSVSANIAGSEIVGGLIGYSSISGDIGDDGYYIKRCSFAGKLSAKSAVAGIIGGCGGNTTIAGCKADVEITVEDNYAAGIATSSSTIFGTSIIGSYALGKIKCSKGSANAIGGLVATYMGVNSTIDNCYSMIVCNSTNFSGLCGCENSGDHWNCDCSGIVNCASIMPETHSVVNCTSTGSNFSDFLQSCHSAYESYWDFEERWIWKGNVNGQDRSVTCPLLAWE